MPIVLFSDPKPRSGHAYDDRTGVSYEFPDRYLRLVQEGERFLYHRKGPPGYTGTGIVGTVTASPKPDHSLCEILDYQPFENRVLVMDPEGYFYEAEPGSGKKGVFFAQGVRPISEDSFERVLVAAGIEPTEPASGGTSGGGYAETETRIAVERYAVEVALELLRAEHPTLDVEELARNNPGFDILVGSKASPHAYIEVKGTQSSDPVFWMSEGERQFSIAHPDQYELIVVAGIDLEGEKPHVVHRRTGPVAEPGVTLEPSQWKGRLEPA